MKFKVCLFLTLLLSQAQAQSQTQSQAQACQILDQIGNQVFVARPHQLNILLKDFGYEGGSVQVTLMPNSNKGFVCSNVNVAPSISVTEVLPVVQSDARFSIPHLGIKQFMRSIPGAEGLSLQYNLGLSPKQNHRLYQLLKIYKPEELLSFDQKIGYEYFDGLKPYAISLQLQYDIKFTDQGM